MCLGFCCACLAFSPAQLVKLQFDIKMLDMESTENKKFKLMAKKRRNESKIHFLADEENEEDGIGDDFYASAFSGETMPDAMVLKRSNLAEAVAGIFSVKEVKMETVFGPFIGFNTFERRDEYNSCSDIEINCMESRKSNWMKYVNPSHSAQNLEAFQHGIKIYFRAIKDIPPSTELLVWYSNDYSQDHSDYVCKPTQLFEMISNMKEYKDISIVQNLQVHKRALIGQKPYKCDICKKYFHQRGDLQKHKVFHTDEKPYKCDICKKSFHQSGDLQKHKRTHTGEKPHKCDVCKKLFSLNGNLQKHKRTHTGEKLYKCDVCNMPFSQSSDLKVHKRTHTGEKPYKCDKCNMAFTQSGSLKDHTRFHTGEKPYKCDKCNMAFSQSGNLVAHKRTHTGEKPYKCDKCNMAFSQSSHLKVHKRTHTGEKPYKCDICKMAFSQSGSLKDHKCTRTREKPHCE